MLISESIIDIAPFERILTQTLVMLGQPACLSVGLELVEKDEIRAVNAEQRKVDRVTDVLSFPTLALVAGEVIDPKNYPYDIDLATGELYLGDVLICHDVAVEQAQEYGHSVDREMGYLLVHAILHLLGYDHIQDEDKTLMRQQEERILTALGLVRDE